MRTTLYIDQLRGLTRTGSLYGVAQLLGLTENAIKGYHRGTRSFDAYAAVRTAELLELDPLEVLAAANCDREKHPEKAAYWCQLLEAAEAKRKQTAKRRDKRARV